MERHTRRDTALPACPSRKDCTGRCLCVSERRTISETPSYVRRSDSFRESVSEPASSGAGEPALYVLVCIRVRTCSLLGWPAVWLRDIRLCSHVLYVPYQSLSQLRFLRV